jgi:hypothetical protein
MQRSSSFALSDLLVAWIVCAGCNANGPKAGPEGGADTVSEKGDPGDSGEPGMDGRDGAASTPGVPKLAFDEAPFPINDEMKRQVIASVRAYVDGAPQDIGFHTILRSGDVLGANTFGLLIDQSGDPILTEDGSPDISARIDFSSLLPIGDRLYEVTHFESRPAAMYLTELEQSSSGMLSAFSTKPVDMSGVDGLWGPCAGSVTPWGTHLGSEETPTDAKSWEAATALADFDTSDFDYMAPMWRYFGLDIYTPDAIDKADVERVFKPYNYGHPVEVTLDASGNATVAKHYAMGRMSVELARVMPDQKTAYITDDGTNGGLYLFVADTVADLSAGNLYAMKWLQTGDEGLGEADIAWVDLGHATDAEVDGLLHPISGPPVVFSDIFDSEEPVSGACPTTGFVSINTEAGNECLKLEAGMGLAASRLETRRYAAYLGATTELRKEEGIAFDPDTHTLFVSLSWVGRGMEDAPTGTYDVGGPNDIRLTRNDCGGVYALPLATDAAIGSDYVAQQWKGLVAGVPTSYDASGPYVENTCSINGIANPDNLTFIEGKDTLIIAEDSSDGHQNDVVWAYDTNRGSLTRLQTTPYGSEATSVYWYPNINGFAYLKSIVQHPYGESDQDKLVDSADRRAYDAFIGPFRL